MSVSEAWMLHVALEQGRIKPGTNLDVVARSIIKTFLGDGTWESPKGYMVAANLNLADKILAKVNAPKLASKSLQAIAHRFVGHKAKQYAVTDKGNDIKLSAAPMTGKNPGSVYVHVNDTYAGKITPYGTFSPAIEDCAPNGVFYKDMMETLLKMEAANAALLKEEEAASGAPTVKTASGYAVQSTNAEKKALLTGKYDPHVSIPLAVAGKLAEHQFSVSDELKKKIVGEIVNKMEKKLGKPKW